MSHRDLIDESDSFDSSDRTDSWTVLPASDHDRDARVDDIPRANKHTIIVEKAQLGFFLTWLDVVCKKEPSKPLLF